jgi:hypothetical protein
LYSTLKLKYLKISKLEFKPKVTYIGAVAMLKTDKMMGCFDEDLVDLIGHLTALYEVIHTWIITFNIVSGTCI